MGWLILVTLCGLGAALVLLRTSQGDDNMKSKKKQKKTRKALVEDVRQDKYSRLGAEDEAVMPETAARSADPGASNLLVDPLDKNHDGVPTREELSAPGSTISPPHVRQYHGIVLSQPARASSVVPPQTSHSLVQ